MQTHHTDTLGRATFGHIEPRGDVRPTARELRWLKHLERHGPQSSAALLALTSDTHRCRDTGLRQLQKLRAGGYLRLPPQQRATARAPFNPYIYDLTPKARDHLVDLALDEPTIRPTGHWWHGYMTSCVTGSLDIAAARAGVRYIPAHEILARTQAELALPLGRAKLIPDQLFAFDYGGRFRAFALEVDRGTEPKTSPARRKSWARSLTQYQDVLVTERYKAHYGLKATLLVLFVFTSRAKQRRFLKFIAEQRPSRAGQFLTQTIDPDATSGLFPQLYEYPWSTGTGQRVSIATS